MSAYVEYELHCDGSPGMEPLDCPTPSVFDSSAKAAREIAATAGWVTGHRDGKVVDLCPNHRQGFTRWKRARGICSGCGQERALTTLGDVVAKHGHPNKPPGQRWHDWCPGSHKPPVGAHTSAASEEADRG